MVANVPAPPRCRICGSPRVEIDEAPGVSGLLVECLRCEHRFTAVGALPDTDVAASATRRVRTASPAREAAPAA